jgi:hypothetical protein
LSPQTVLTKLVWIATKSRRKGLRTDGQQQSCRLWACPLQVFGPQGPSLTNRMSELLTYGSVGGVGRKPGPYPAADSLSRCSFMIGFIYFIRLVAAPGCPAAAQLGRRHQASRELQCK